MTTLLVLVGLVVMFGIDAVAIIGAESPLTLDECAWGSYFGGGTLGGGCCV